MTALRDYGWHAGIHICLPPREIGGTLFYEGDHVVRVAFRRGLGKGKRRTGSNATRLRAGTRRVSPRTRTHTRTRLSPALRFMIPEIAELFVCRPGRQPTVASKSLPPLCDLASRRSYGFSASVRSAGCQPMAWGYFLRTGHASWTRAENTCLASTTWTLHGNVCRAASMAGTKTT